MRSVLNILLSCFIKKKNVYNSTSKTEKKN